MLKNLTIETFSRLLGYLYDGHLEEDPYNRFLELIRDVLDLNFASITLREPIGEDGGLLFISCDSLKKTYADDHENPYTDRYYTSDLMVELPWGKPVTIDELIPYSSFESSDLYKICMAPINIYHMVGLDLRNANGQRFTVRLCRPRNATNFDLEEKMFLEDLGGHIQRAVANGMQLIRLDSEHKLFPRTISGLSIGIISLNERGRVVSFNSAAEQLIRAKDGLSIVNDQIHLGNQHAREKLNSYIAEVIKAQRTKETAPVHVLGAPRPSGKANYEVLIKPLTVDKNVESGNSPHLMVFVSDPEKKYEIDVKVLMDLYQLTRAESLLAKHLSSGMTLDECATALGIARNTARAQLRAIFAKTGVTQQSILVSLILKSLARFS